MSWTEKDEERDRKLVCNVKTERNIKDRSLKNSYREFSRPSNDPSLYQFTLVSCTFYSDCSLKDICRVGGEKENIAVVTRLAKVGNVHVHDVIPLWDVYHTAGRLPLLKQG